MRRIADLPFRVREIENLWIPVRDGIRLAARAWLPETAERDPVPAILEYIPYRKRDMTALRDTATHGYLAGHGYACVRLDARGIGDSEGIYGDQFTEQYVDDAEDAIAWLAVQPWCDGAVAMFGLSWGGAIALQTAARRPPALKTIICAAGIDVRDALRYPGGCLATATVSGIVAQLSYATRPPDPAIVGRRWREMWLTRLEAAAPTLDSSLRHSLRDEPWRAASLAEDYSRIACPALLSAGWADPAFAAAMLRSLERLEVPRRGIFGPWAHRYPHLAIPGPAIHYLGETLRWLDHWLKGRDTGILAEPLLRAFLPHGFGVAPTPEDRSGRWIGAASWPEARREFWLGRDGLAPDPQREWRTELASPLCLAGAAGEFMPLFASDCGPELSGDQREEDARSLCFDSARLDAPLALLGTPLLHLDLETERPAGQIVARLCEVAPDGSSRRLSWAARNLALTDDLAARRAAGGGVAIALTFFPIAETLAAGSRVRIALSRSYWPLLWPADNPRITLGTAESRLSLPIVAAPAECRGFAEPEAAPTLRWSQLQPAAYRREERFDAVTGERLLALTDDMGVGRIDELDLELAESTTRRYRLRADDPGSAALATETRCSFRRGDWSAATIVRGEVARDGGDFVTRHTLEASEGGDLLFSRSWERHIRTA